MPLVLGRAEPLDMRQAVPLARCGCGGGACNCTIVPGANVSVDGSGSAANPYIISAVFDCGDVRPCISAANGLDYDPATGVVSADVSEQAGNNLIIAPDGGLYVPTGAATVSTGCGLTGTGAASSPLRVATGTWPYACPADTSGGVVVCGSDGVLRGEPRAMVSATSFTEIRDYPNLPVPSGTDELADTFQTTVVNPDPCRPALVFVEREADVDFTLPPGAGGAYGHANDETVYHRNTGSTTEANFHIQTTKVFPIVAPLGPGASMPIPFEVHLGKGTGGATYNRIGVYIRALMISL